MFAALPKPIRMFLLLPVFTMLWGTANSLGVTSYVSEETGLPDLNTWEIPGLAELVNISDFANDAQREAKAKARRAAIAMLKKEVERRYGPEAAALIPNDLSKQEAKNFDFKQFEKLLDKKLPGGVPTPGMPTKTPQPPKPTKTPAGDREAYAKALKTLDTLAVKGKAPMTGYDRDEFGSEWDDAVGTWAWSRNGCDTRNDVLKRDLVNVKFDGGDCDVASGTLKYDVYSGEKNYRFDSTDDEYATDLDVEHYVALGNVWVTGGSQMPEEKRALIANDPINLEALNPSLNRQKGDADFATWLPPNKSFRCEYAAIQIAVKNKYSLWVTPAEKEAMKRVLQGCV